MSQPLTAADIPFANPVDGGVALAPRAFTAPHEGRYVLTLEGVGIEFDVDRLRRERQELVGELAVRCELAGARTFGGTLSVADFNLSSARSRQDRAKLLAERSKAPEVDWLGLLEEVCQRVLSAERTGSPAVLLRDAAKPEPEADFNIQGLWLPKHEPAFEFGDGGAAKSYLALYVAGVLAERGVRVGYFDWELTAPAHRDRLEKLFGPEMPPVYYVRCERPLVQEADRLRRVARDHGLQYAVFDSVAFACDGPPEAAEVAGAYFRAVRQIGVGSLHIAHVTKSQDSGDQKPFGSVFWHNGARSSWYVKLAHASLDRSEITVGLFHRKANLGPQRPAIGFAVRFEGDRTTLQRVDVAEVNDLADRLPLADRIAHALRDGAKTLAAIAGELDAKVDSVEKAVKRQEGRRFTRIAGKDGVYRIGLVTRPAEAGGERSKAW